MPFIPYYLDGYVEAIIFLIWVVFGVVWIVQGRKKSVSNALLKRRVVVTVVCVIVSIAAYSFYILIRQAYESHNHTIVGSAMSNAILCVFVPPLWE